jgi:hypothetical protein
VKGCNDQLALVLESAVGISEQRPNILQGLSSSLWHFCSFEELWILVDNICIKTDNAIVNQLTILIDCRTIAGDDVVVRLEVQKEEIQKLYGFVCVA